MSFSNGPTIVTNGLVLALDAGDRNSYVSGSSTWFDLVGSNNGTLTNGPTFNTGSGGNIVFDGVDDYVLVSQNGFGTFNNQTWTVEAWVNFDTVNADRVIFSYDYTSHVQPYYATHLRLSSPGLIYLLWNNGSTYQVVQTPGNTITANTWYHIIGIFESGRQQIYINGEIKSSSTNVQTITFYNQPVWVGRANYGGYFDGNMSIVKYYNRALTSIEVLQNYNAQKSKFGL